MTKALITGGAGFIGSNLAEELLKNGYKVIVIDNFSTGRRKNISHLTSNKKLYVYRCDITKKDSFEKYFKKVDYIFHLAGLADIVPSIEKPYEYYNSNVNGTFNVVEAARRYGIKKLIYSASSSCYGIPKKFPTNENAKIQTQYPYALTKYLGEQLVMHWCKVYNLPAISLRLFNVYGNRSRTSGTYGAVFGVFLAQKLANKPFTVVGDGKQTRDFIFVKDVVIAMKKAAESNVHNEIINIGSGRNHEINELVSLLKGKVEYMPKRPGEPDCTLADISKAKKLLKWSPKINLKKGVSSLLQNINYWKDAPVWNSKSIHIATKKWFKYLN